LITYQTLDNGVEVILKENHFSHAVAIQCWVKTGSMDEGPKERGMAHLIEHMLFKGTAKRSVGEIASRVEACGGDINAYTTFDRTVFYLTLTGDHAQEGVELLADAIYNSSFDPTEFDREKEVVLEEIKRSMDDPGAKTGRKMFEVCYAGTEVGRPIIGSEDSVRGFSRDDVVRFYRKWYQPQNLAVVVVGDFDSKNMMRWVREEFGGQKGAEIPARQPFHRKMPAKPVVHIIKGDYKLPRLELAFPAPALENVDTPAMDLAAFALGSGEAARLTRRLRDQRGVLSAVTASAYTPPFGGIFEVSAHVPEDIFLAAVSGIAMELMRLKHHEPVTDAEIARARANVKADRLFRDETVDGQAKSLGFGLTTSHKYVFDDVYTAQINGLAPSSVEEAIRRWLAENQAVIVVLLPESSKLTERDVLDAYETGLGEGRRAPASTGVRKTAKKEVTEKSWTGRVTTHRVMPGVKLIYKQNHAAQIFSMVVVAHGGLRFEGPGTHGMFYAMASMLARASKKRNHVDLATLIEGKGAGLEGFSGKDSYGFEMQCLEPDMEEFLGVFGECFREPVFPKELWTSQKREILESLKSQFDSPANMCIRRFQEEMFGDHPYRFPLSGKRELVEKFTTEKLMRHYTTWRDHSQWVISAIGPHSGDEVEALLKRALKGYRHKKVTKTAAKPHRRPNAEAIELKKNREQAHIVFGFPGLDWHDADRPSLDVLLNILGGNGGRLFLNLRDRDSLAYTVSPICTYGMHGGVVGSYIACAPNKKTQALDSLKREMLLLTKEAPAADEVTRSKSYIVGSHMMDLQRSDSQAMTMALMELYGLGWSDFESYPKQIQKVTVKDVVRVARRLFNEQHAVSVVVAP